MLVNCNSEIATSDEPEISDEITYINCPYAEKDEIKSLGGRWDPRVRMWFVPANTDISPFKRWRLLENNNYFSVRRDK